MTSNTRRLLSLATWAATVVGGCTPKPVEPLVRPAPLPSPLEPKPFELPAFETRQLSNGLKVIVAENHEIPLWDVRLLFNVGTYADPKGKEGLASVTLDMMNEGAAKLSAEELSRELKRLGSDISTAADDDGAIASAHGSTRNLVPTLDLLAKVVLEPTFPAEDWEVKRVQRLADLAAVREDPSGISARVAPTLVYGDAYRGRLASEASYHAITPDDMRGFYTTYIGPDNAIVLVGGDVTADEVVPLLEERLGSWKPGGIISPRADVTLAPTDRTVMYLVDKPGAAQSVIRVSGRGTDRLDPQYYPMTVAMTAFGGAFTSRINSNLREDKGYTYGARCALAHRYGPSLWGCATSVRTDVTAESVVEIQNEIAAALGEKPFTDEEIAFYRGSEIRGFPSAFELTDAILGEQATIWRYGLPQDWTETYIPGVSRVTPEAANQAFKSTILPNELLWLIVGDEAKIRPELEALGVRLVELDRDGRPIEGSK